MLSVLLKNLNLQTEEISTKSLTTHPVRNRNNSESNSTDHTLLVHFSELRQRLVKILLSFVVTVIIVYVSSFWWMTLVISYITRAHVSLHAFSFTEMIQIYVMIIFSSRFVSFHRLCFINCGAFVAPGLHNNERQFIYKYHLFSVLCWCRFCILCWLSNDHSIRVKIINHFEHFASDWL